MKMSNYLSVAAVAMLATSLVPAEEVTHVQKIADQLCAACHGQDGNSTSSNYPKIAGQQAGYLEAQLLAFRDRTRSDKDAQDVMWGWTRALTNQDIKDLAAYYESQRPTAGEAKSEALMQKGAGIFQKGMTDKGIPACAACHGAEAAGSAAAPRLAGQHDRYLVRQLKAFRSMERPAAVAMHALVTNLSDQDIGALAAYLQAK